ncbi:hypothetical protein OROMI_010125 [Orobanche minor]
MSSFGTCMDNIFEDTQLSELGEEELGFEKKDDDEIIDVDKSGKRRKSTDLIHNARCVKVS